MLRSLLLIAMCSISKYTEIFGQCPATSTMSVGYTTVTVSPPGYPSPGYDRNLSCSWLRSSSISGASILYRVTDITVRCAGDTINVYNGVNNTDTNVQTCRNECSTEGSKTIGYEITSTGNVYTTFRSDTSMLDSEKGFKMYMISGKDFSGTGCTATQTLTANTTEHYLSSPSFPNTYPNNKNCTWEISATDSSANITIDIKFLNIEKDESSCIYDYLKISESGTSKAKLCDEGTDTVWVPAKTYTSTGNSFTVHMWSDSSVEKQGFLLSYIQTGPVTTEATTTEATTGTTRPVTTEATTTEATTGTTIASSSNTSSTEPKDSQAGIIAGVIVVVLVVPGGVVIYVFCVIKCSVGAANKNKKKEEEVGLPLSSDIRGNADNIASLSCLRVDNNKVSPMYNDYVIYALPTCDKERPHRPVFVGEWEQKYSL